MRCNLEMVTWLAKPKRLNLQAAGRRRSRGMGRQFMVSNEQNIPCDSPAPLETERPCVEHMPVVRCCSRLPAIQVGVGRPQQYQGSPGHDLENFEQKMQTERQQTTVAVGLKIQIGRSKGNSLHRGPRRPSSRPAPILYPASTHGRMDRINFVQSYYFEKPHHKKYTYRPYILLNAHTDNLIFFPF